MEIQAIKQRFGIIGDSAGLNYALSIAMRVAPTDLTVLITGESGVGKEIFSQIIHSLSPRKHNPFIAVNCGAIPEGTIDSELFGHEKGAFTGAHEARKGYFETVNGGTIFLDEIGELPLGTQARLLRVLETGEYIRVGSSKVFKTDVRVIAASNVDLALLIRQNKFREDLYYRLNTVPIKVPPLRERQDDIYWLFRKFCVDFAERYRISPIELDEEAKIYLLNYPWPGNVRELKNVAEQISVLSKSRKLNADELENYLPANTFSSLPMIPESNDRAGHYDYSEREIMYKLLFDMRNDLNELKSFVLKLADGNELPDSIKEVVRHEPAYKAIAPSEKPVVIDKMTQLNIEEEESLSIADKEKELIVKALKKHKGKRKDAALDLGISERTLYRKIKEYTIHE